MGHGALGMGDEEVWEDKETRGQGKNLQEVFPLPIPLVPPSSSQCPLPHNQ
ncbi:MAG: hypothetical protein V7L23_35535 [Nostoc sp.]|uniref:hypothetical protein n=1 Tax=Nostoc sp. TaxID=1180 RepID=UPI002FF270EC